MNTRKCGCVYADARNNSHVRSGHELGGYLMKPCAEHSKPAEIEMNTTENVKMIADALADKGMTIVDADYRTRVAALVKAAKLARVAMSSVAVPSPAERAILQEGADILSAALKDFGHG